MSARQSLFGEAGGNGSAEDGHGQIELGLARRDDGVRVGGGAGLAIVRAWSRIVACERIDGRNRLELLVTTGP